MAMSWKKTAFAVLLLSALAGAAIPIVQAQAPAVDPAAVQEQLTLARRVFQRGGFAVIDITNRPIEESASEVIALVTRHRRPPGRFDVPGQRCL